MAPQSIWLKLPTLAPELTTPFEAMMEKSPIEASPTRAIGKITTPSPSTAPGEILAAGETMLGIRK